MSASISILMNWLCTRQRVHHVRWWGGYIYQCPELRLRSGLWPQTKILWKFLEKEKGSPFTFSWFQSCCGWRLRLTANRKLAVAVAVAVRNIDHNSGYGTWSHHWLHKYQYGLIDMYHVTFYLVNLRGGATLFMRGKFFSARKKATPLS